MIDAEVLPSHFPQSAHRALIILTVIACGVVAWATQDFLMPTATAVVLALALTPVVRGLEYLGLPTAAASIVVIAVTGAILVGSAIAIAPGMSELIRRAPEMARTIELKTRPVKAWLTTLQTATDKLDEVTHVSGGGGLLAAGAPSQSSGGAIVEFAPQVLAQTIYVLVLALFLISVRATYRKRLILLPASHENRLRVSRIINETLAQVSHYLFITTLINAGVGVTTGLAFAMLGVPYATAWGFAFGVACFIPYIGPTAVIALCAVAQMVTAPSLEAAVMPPIFLILINLIESNFVTPWLVSRRLAVSSIAVFLTVAVFAWLWGPFAAVVAVPLLILFSAFARHVPGLEPWAVLLLAENETTLHVKETGLSKFIAGETTLCADTIVVQVWWRRVLATRFGGFKAPSASAQTANST